MASLAAQGESFSKKIDGMIVQEGQLSWYMRLIVVDTPQMTVPLLGHPQGNTSKLIL